MDNVYFRRSLSNVRFGTNQPFTLTAYSVEKLFQRHFR